jgi:hypothetical protein
MELAKYDESDAATTPNAMDGIPAVLRPPKRFPWKTVGWCGLVATGVFLLSLAIAVTASFLVDLSYMGGGLYAAGVVLSSASLGALLISVVWSVRRSR